MVHLAEELVIVFPDPLSTARRAVDNLFFYNILILCPSRCDPCPELVWRAYENASFRLPLPLITGCLFTRGALVFSRALVSVVRISGVPLVIYRITAIKHYKVSKKMTFEAELPFSTFWLLISLTSFSSAIMIL